MKTHIEIRGARPDEIDVVRTLLNEYAASLQLDLSFQNFAGECAGLPGEYAPPGGALLLAHVDGVCAGMVALRRRGGERCEMKRLYVRPAARGLGVGRQLVAGVLDEARRLGYREMVLDSLPVMADAQRLYENTGFRDVPPYYESPVPGTRFMALDLTRG